MASRKEEKERLRKEREEAERRERGAERKRLVLGYGVAGLITVAVVVGIVFAIASGGGGNSSDAAAEGFGEVGVVPEGTVLDERDGTEPPELVNANLDSAAEAAGCELRRDLPNEGSDHFSDESKTGNWKTEPPTSGDHYGVPTEITSGALAAGPYMETPPLSRAVHSLEHGRIEIQYSPDLPEEDQLALKGVFDEVPDGVLLFPNPDMPFDVAATAWTQLLGCESFEGDSTLDAIRDFRDEFLGRGPEAIPLEQ